MKEIKEICQNINIDYPGVDLEIAFQNSNLLIQNKHSHKCYFECSISHIDIQLFECVEYSEVYSILSSLVYAISEDNEEVMFNDQAIVGKNEYRSRQEILQDLSDHYSVEQGYINFLM